jgi:coenzyme F420 hydrogenase subunit beta
MPEQTPTERLYAIVEQGLCIGCGLCQSIAGPDSIKVVKTSSGYEHPVVVGNLDNATVDDIYDACPGTRIDGLPPGLIDETTRIDNVWGPWRRMVRAWASDTEVRYEGSTGGVLSALASYLLASKRVDFILHARASTTEPTFGESHLSFTHADVMQAAGSRYGPTAPLIGIREVLDRGQPFAFIGKPCDISALRNFSRHDNRVDQLVKYWLTPVCGGYMPPLSTQKFLQRNDIDPESVTAFRYRGRGCPGPMRIETKNQVKELHYLDFWGEDASQWSLPFRCKVCPDGIGEAADIAAADTWPDGSPTREDSEDDPGTNAIIARTVAGIELLESAQRDGAITIEYDVTPDDMSFYQPHQMRKKYAVWARYQGLADEGRVVPQVNRLRIEELAAELTEDTNEQQRAGTRRRIREGKVKQPTPVAAESKKPEFP